MKKILILSSFIIVIIFAIFLGIKLFVSSNDNEILNDSKVDVNNYMEIEKEVDSKEEIKLSPNCSFIFKKIYDKCGHVSTKYSNCPNELVNKTKKDIEEKYMDWKIEKFDSNNVEFVRNVDGECGEHYILKNIDGKLVVYVVNELGNEIEYLKTDISTQYMTLVDKNVIDAGLKVYGKKNLNQVLEDFE